MSPLLARIGAVAPALSIATLCRPCNLEAWDHPRVLVKAQIDSTIILRHISSEERKRLLYGIEQLIADEATKRFRCMEWIALPSLQVVPQAELRPTLIETPFGARKRVFLAYTAVLKGNKFSLGPSLDLKLLDVDDYPDASTLHLRLKESVQDQFRSDSFQRLFNEVFIERVHIANSAQPGVDQNRLMIPVEAGRLSLELESPLIFRLKGALCTQEVEPCSASLESAGAYETGRWIGALRTRLKEVHCCPGIQWEDFVGSLVKVRDIEVFLHRNHKHCEYPTSFCSGGGLAKYPKTL